MEDNNISILFDVRHIQQTRITMHEELTCCAGACGSAQMQHNQKQEEADLGRLELLLRQSELRDMSGSQLS